MVDISGVRSGVPAQVDTAGLERVKRQGVRGSSNPVPPAPPPADGGGIAGGRPNLPAPSGMDATSMLNAYLTLKVQNDNDQTLGAMNDIRSTGKIKHEQNVQTAELAKKAADEQAKAKKNGLAMKILGWVATALTVVAAIAVAVVSFGTLAVVGLAAAAVAVTMMSLSESGQMQKWQNQLAENYMKGGMSEDEAKQKAAKTMMWIQIGVSAATAIAGLGGAAASLAGVGVSAARTAATVARLGQTAVTAARVTAGVAQGAAAASTIAQSGMSIDSAVKAHQSAMDTATILELKKLLAKEQAESADEQDTLQQLVEASNKFMSRIGDVVRNAAQSMETTIGSGQQMQTA